MSWATDNRGHELILGQSHGSWGLRPVQRPGQMSVPTYGSSDLRISTHSPSLRANPMLTASLGGETVQPPLHASA